MPENFIFFGTTSFCFSYRRKSVFSDREKSQGELSTERQLKQFCKRKKTRFFLLCPVLPPSSFSREERERE
jgi:hypothetical protein